MGIDGEVGTGMSVLNAPLVPLADVESDASGGWITAGPKPQFEIVLDAARWAGAWVECEIAISTDIASLNPSLHVHRTGTGTPLNVHPFRCNAHGRGRWSGLLPSDLKRLTLDPIGMSGRFEIRSVTLRRLPRATVLARAVRVDPVKVARALGWRLLGKRLRSRHFVDTALRRERGTSYADWIRLNDRLSSDEVLALREMAAGWRDPPLISIVMPVYNPAPRDLDAAIASVRRQIYPYWELRIADDASTDRRVARVLDRAAAADSRIHVVRRSQNGHISAASNTALEGVTGPFTALMDHDDLLPEHALVYVAREIVERPDLDLIYSDEDKVDGRGRRYEPHFKPDWNQELFLTLNFVSHLGVFRTDLLRRIGGFRVGLEGSQDHDLVLRCLAHTDETRIRHIPRILYHWRNYRRSQSFSEKQIDKAVVARRRALADFAASKGWDAEIVDGPIGANRLRRRLPERPPEVTVVVPTRDGADLLATCARGVLSETNYDPLRLVILDNESREPATQHLFRDLARDSRVAIMPMPGPFNFSAMNNAAVRASSSDLVLFLNNDIEVVDQEWLSEMVGLAMSDGVAAVGAKLLYPDRRVQHGGIILGAGGIAGHAHLFFGALDPGYFGRAVLPQYLSAVTAACMLVRREAFLEVGGFDEEALTVAFNDVDLCLKLRARGHKIAWTPYATLIHHESASRGLDLAPAKRARFESETATMLERWGHALRRDPYYNPNLSLELAQFRLKGVDQASLEGRRSGFLR